LFMASRSARGRRTSQDSASHMRGPERTRRSLSQGDDTGVNLPAPGQSHESNTAEHSHASKRLGFLGEMLLSSAASVSSTSTLRGTPAQARSHSRADSANLLSRDASASPVPTSGMAASPAHHAKGHASPSKVSTISSQVTIEAHGSDNTGVTSISLPSERFDHCD
jgi:hypothetical protein